MLPMTAQAQPVEENIMLISMGDPFILGFVKQKPPSMNSTVYRCGTHCFASTTSPS